MVQDQEHGDTCRKICEAVQAMQERQATEWTARFIKGCAGMFGCGDPKCRLCTVTAHLPQPTSGVAELARRQSNATRDGAGKLKGGGNLAFKKRKRLGPGR